MNSEFAEQFNDLPKNQREIIYKEDNKTVILRNFVLSVTFKSSSIRHKKLSWITIILINWIYHFVMRDLLVFIVMRKINTHIHK